MYELVPYLKNDGNRHDFSHTLHYLYFTADDEADESKAQVSREMRERLGIYQHPLDNYMGRVRVTFTSRVLFTRRPSEARSFIDLKSTIHVPLLPQGRIDPIPYSGR